MYVRIFELLETSFTNYRDIIDIVRYIVIPKPSVDPKDADKHLQLCHFCDNTHIGM